MQADRKTLKPSMSHAFINFTLHNSVSLRCQTCTYWYFVRQADIPQFNYKRKRLLLMNYLIIMADLWHWSRLTVIPSSINKINHYQPASTNNKPQSPNTVAKSSAIISQNHFDTGQLHQYRVLKFKYPYTEMFWRMTLA